MKWYYTKDAFRRILRGELGWLLVGGLVVLILATASKAQRASDPNQVFNIEETLRIAGLLAAIAIALILFSTLWAAIGYVIYRKRQKLSLWFSDFIKAVATGVYWGLLITLIGGTVLSLALLEVNLPAMLVAAAEAGVSIVSLWRKYY